MDLQNKGRYDLMYQKAQQLPGRISKAIRTFGIKNNQGNIVTDHQWAIKIWGKCLQYLYDLENRPKSIGTEVEEELDEDDQGPTVFISEVVKAIKDMQKKVRQHTSGFTHWTGRQWIKNNDCTG